MFKIKFEELEYFIFASTGVLKCFICKIEGHVARNCITSQTQEHSIATNAQPNNNNKLCTNNSIAIDKQKLKAPNTFENDNIIENKQNQMEINYDSKRTHSVISSEESQCEIIVETVQENSKSLNQPSKKTKVESLNISKALDDDKHYTDHSTSVKSSTSTQSQNDNNTSKNNSDPIINKDDALDKRLISIKEYFNNAGTILNYIQFKSLLENTHKVKQPAFIICQYTNDLGAFKKFIKEDVYPNVRDSSIKTRCTKL